MMMMSIAGEHDCDGKTSHLNNDIDLPSIFAMFEIWNHSSEQPGKLSETFVSRIDAVDETCHLKTRGK